MIDKEKVRELVTSMCGANYTEFDIIELQNGSNKTSPRRRL